MGSDLTPTRSDRGFNRMAPTAGTVPGELVEVYESSAAMGPHIWIKVTEPDDRNKAVMGEDVKRCMSYAHLSLEAATDLRDKLSWLIDNHYQVRDK